jgi:aryl-alcohol dehydrogenase-like predicted oxidoreductase
MKMRFLGKSGLKVSELCFGTMTFGGTGYWKVMGELTQKDANNLVNIAIEGGINFFDTADVYSTGIAEEMLGKALGARRKDLIVATKVRGKMGPGPNDAGLSRKHILEGCDASLKRLGTDYIDLYQVHSFDPYTPLEETMRALDDLVRQGKVRHLGCSNFAGWQLMKALSISEKNGWEKFITLQAYYNIIERDLEFELVPLCVDQGLGILPWSPLAGGFLTGKYKRGQTRPSGARRTDPENQFLRFDEEKGFEILGELEKIADAHSASISQVALNYLLKKPNVSSVITGARTKGQLEDNIKTVNWVLTQEEVLHIDELSNPPRIYPYWMLGFTRKDRE